MKFRPTKKTCQDPASKWGRGPGGGAVWKMAPPIATLDFFFQ